MDYIGLYNQKFAANQPVEKTAEEKLAEEQLEQLQKYAEFAESELQKTYGKDYTAEDVTKLASMLITRDIQQEEALEKVAEWTQAGQIMGHAAAQTFIETIKGAK